MKAAAFADLVQARAVGAKRWQAKCPAHDDSSPSLSISEGIEGRVLVRCWAGCSLASILQALHLKPSDLFNAEPLSPEALALARVTRLKQEAELRKQAATERRLADYVRRGNLAVMALGARLAGDPTDASTATLFHTALDWLRAAEQGFPHD